MTTVVLVGGAGFGVVWVLHKIGKALAAILEALATLAMVFLALWVLVKTVFWLVRTVVVHWRTSIGATAVAAWLVVWGWLSLVLTVVAVAAGLVVWRVRHRASFDPWVGRRLRSWWQRWTVYAPTAAVDPGVRVDHARVRPAGGADGQSVGP